MIFILGSESMYEGPLIKIADAEGIDSSNVVHSSAMIIKFPMTIH